MYITKNGDTWDSIAYEKYGDCERMEELLAANSRYSDIVVFDYGTVLEIPAKTEFEAAAFAPPWRV